MVLREPTWSEWYRFRITFTLSKNRLKPFQTAYGLVVINTAKREISRGPLFVEGQSSSGFNFHRWAILKCTARICSLTLALAHGLESSIQRVPMVTKIVSQRAAVLAMPLITMVTSFLIERERGCAKDPSNISHYTVITKLAENTPTVSTTYLLKLIIAYR